MTFSQDNPTQGEEPQYPMLFGMTITPKLGGILLGVFGLLAALYIIFNLVFPAQQENQKLEADRDAKESELNQLKSGQGKKMIQELEQKVQEKEKLKPQVLALFSDQKSLDVLLLDINKLMKQNGVKLIKYEPEATEPSIIEDGSLGNLVNGKLKRKNIDIEMEGTFSQIQATMNDLEQYQPLLLIKNYQSNISELVVYPSNQLGSKVTVLSAPPKLNTSMRLEVIMPLSDEELSEIRRVEEEKLKAQQSAQPAAQPPNPAQKSKK